MSAFSVLLLIAAGAMPHGVEGSWLTDDRKGVVQIAPCGPQMCGHIVRVLDKGPNVPATDINNPDPKRRGQPIMGLLTLSGFRRDGAIWKGGRAYDPKSGRSYRATLGLNPDGSLRVTGCVLFLCESQRWTRVN
ncbi:DUF2147 domain-containing protein [Sphingobium sp. EM0848]|uniref:DUF2147 domain-containing protein n=1 Tax=Sphingobium sp. EM0848 TaxID=2743473 RepID=UPI002100C93D|nr:DUF2147 domain-containing protein [Sphingobium sp. EM0848]